eukprot:3528483-Pyramimonas_sp.AAC.1
MRAQAVIGASGGAPHGAMKRCTECADMERGRHANVATGTFGGVPYGATKRGTEWGGRMRTPPLGPSVELPVGSRSPVLGGGGAWEHRH